MNPQASFRRKIIYLVLIVVLLTLLSLLGRPASNAVDQTNGSPGGLLAQLRKEHELSQAELGEIDPTGEAIKLACLGMRGIAANILWKKASDYQKKKDWINLRAALEQITKLQPNFIAVWRHQAWNLSYNVSVAFDDFRDRYYWVIEGINYLRKGMVYNKREPRLLWDIGWFTCQKIGRSDERKQFRRLFEQDHDYHDALPFRVIHRDPRDNWQVGRYWFRWAEELVDSGGTTMKGMSPLIFHSSAPMCPMHYAANLEEDGTFGEVAQREWENADAEWEQYGSITLPTTYRVPVRLNEQEMFEEEAKQAVDQLEALQPGLRDGMIEEKRAELPDDQREALDTPPLERTKEQYKLAAEAEKAIKVTHKDLARKIKGRNRREAIDLAKRATVAEEKAGIIRQQRSIVNFEYWRLRAEIEQTDNALAARQLIYEGDLVFDSAPPAAKAKYDAGMAKWLDVLEEFPQLLSEDSFVLDLMEVIQRYKRILAQLDAKDLVDGLPKSFVLQEVVDKSKGLQP